jgi:signal transduction histidine kinase
VSSATRCRALERLFFHDIMNTAIGVRGLSEIMADAPVEQLDELRSMIRSGAGDIVDDIQAQRLLTIAENGGLTVAKDNCDSLELLRELHAVFSNSEAVRQRELVVAEESESIRFVTDKALITAVLGAMVRNALEASSRGAEITMSCRLSECGVEFSVHNEGVMPEETRFQVFLRGFSTKGSGRGTGTYRMKLFAERYLGGRAWFTSRENEGTIFRVCLPVSPPEWAAR